MTSDFTPLYDAEKRLENALGVYEEFQADPRLRELMRAGVIGIFAHAYDLACKMLRRHVIAVSASSEAIERASFAQLIRAGYAHGLLNEEFVVWKTFRDRRNATSHGYDGRKAQEVLEAAPRFLTEVQYLAARLRAESASSDDR